MRDEPASFTHCAGTFPLTKRVKRATTLGTATRGLPAQIGVEQPPPAAYPALYSCVGGTRTTSPSKPEWTRIWHDRRLDGKQGAAALSSMSPSSSDGGAIAS